MAWLNGDCPAQGRLVGGCIEVLEFLKGTRYWQWILPFGVLAELDPTSSTFRLLEPAVD